MDRGAWWTVVHKVAQSWTQQHVCMNAPGTHGELRSHMVQCGQTKSLQTALPPFGEGKNDVREAISRHTFHWLSQEKVNHGVYTGQAVLQPWFCGPGVGGAGKTLQRSGCLLEACLAPQEWASFRSAALLAGHCTLWPDADHQREAPEGDRGPEAREGCLRQRLPASSSAPVDAEENNECGYWAVCTGLRAEVGWGRDSWGQRCLSHLLGFLPLYPLCLCVEEPETIIIVSPSPGCVSAKHDARCSG